MQATIRYLAVLIAFVVLSPHSYAQTRGKYLEGIARITVGVGTLTVADGAEICGVTKEGLVAAAKFPVATSQLSLGGTPQAFLEINALVATTVTRGCAASVHVEVIAQPQSVTLDSTGLHKIPDIRLWGNSALSIGPADGFDRRIREMIEDMAKDFVVDWTLDQQ